MKALLKLENVGGFQGTKTFEFQAGAVNEIEAPNAMGKTTIARGLAAVLSMPITHPETVEEARHQGIFRESLKNIYEKDASVRLQYNERTEEWKMASDGSIVRVPTYGDERFVWAGMLTQQARTIRQLVEGNSDFSWVPRRLSWADRYATAKALVDAQLSEVGRDLSAIRRRQELLVEKNKELQAKRREKAELERQRDEFAQKLDLGKRKHIERIKALSKQLDLKRQEIAKYEASIIATKQEISWLESRLESNAKNISEVEKQLQEIDLEVTRREVHEQVSRIDEQLAKLRSQAARLNAQKSTLADAKAILIQRGETEGTCPVCQVSTITLNFLDERLGELNTKLREIEQAVLSLSGERARWMQKEATERRQIEQLLRAKAGLEDERRELASRKARYETTLQATELELGRLKNEQLAISKEKIELDKETEKWAAEVHEALKRIEKALEVASDAIAKGMRKIQEDSFIEIWERQTFLEHAQRWLEEYRSKLTDLREYLDQKQHEHEIKAIAQFNISVRKVMDDLGFTEFDQIAIDQDDKQLKVFRAGFVQQPLESLSTSEKYSIAIALQIALKETYLPDIPFFVVDEVVVSYDKERKERILDYLNELAHREGLYVIVTTLAEKVIGDIIVKVR